MLPRRKEISDYSRSCEHLIAAAASPDAVPFTPDEIDWITYYATAINNPIDSLVRKSKTQVHHDRQTLQEFAVTSEALFLTKGLSEGENDSLRDSVSDVPTNILDEK
jgi:hypothetical protein